MIWLDIPGYEGHYQVSNTGEVRSLPRTLTMKNGVERLTQVRLLAQTLAGDGKGKTFP